jgi:predicted enzyme related to lactoylglutathione lyase
MFKPWPRGEREDALSGRPELPEDRVVPVKRVIAYADGTTSLTSEAFYCEVLGLEVAMRDPVLGLVCPDGAPGQVIIPPRGMENPAPAVGVDLGEPTAVDAAHAAAVAQGLRVVYPIRDEPWGVRRFFVEDPSGTIVNVLAHLG